MFKIKDGLRVGLTSVIDSSGSILTNAASASKLLTPITIALSGDLVGNVSTDLSGNVTINATVSGGIANTASNALLLNGNSASYYLNWSNFTNTPTTVSGYGITDAVTTSGSQSISGTKTFDDVVINNLTVNGNTTVVNSTDLSVSDSIITLASGNSNAAVSYIGLKAERGSTDAFWVYDESIDRWSAYTSSNDLTSKSSVAIQGDRFFTGVSTGTAPFVTASTTLNSNFNADLLDGQEGTYYQNATNITAGTLADARLPTSMAGKTFTTPLAVQAGNSVANFSFINLTPTDFALGKPQLNFKKYPTASTWSIELWDGTNNAGTLNLAAGNTTITANATVGGTMSVTGATSLAGTSVTGTLAVTGALTLGGSSVWTAANDGVGSGLDADLLDGQHGSYYQNATNITAGTLADARLSSNVVLENGTNTFTALQTVTVGNATTVGEYFRMVPSDTGTGKPYLLFQKDSTASKWNMALWDGTNNNGTINITASSLTHLNSTVWTAGNDGSGSGLDADLIDGVDLSTIVPSLRAGTNMTGGGTVSYISGNLKWTSRFIVMANGRGSQFASQGYFDITIPATSTVITGVGGATSATVTSNGVPMSSWQALYYILPIGGAAASVDANFRIATYSSNIDIPYNWVLIALVNNDGTVLKLGTGQFIQPGETLDTTAYSSVFVPDADKLDGLDSTAFALASHTHIIADVTGLQTALDAKLANSAYTAADVLSKLLTVDGATSGLDADLLDGQHGSYYLSWTNITSKPTTLTGYGITDAQPLDTGLTSVAALTGAGVVTTTATDAFAMRFIGVANSTDIADRAAADSRYLQSSAYTAADVLSKLLTVDGTGSGLDADLLDGLTTASAATASTVMTRDGSGSTNLNVLTANSVTLGNSLFGKSGDNNSVHFYSPGSFIPSTTTTANNSSIGTSAYQWKNGYFGALIIANASTIGGNTIWHAGNDGASSTLDADLLDGQEGVYYSNATNLISGAVPAARMPALTGDITTSAGAVATTLATVNSNVGAFGNVTQVGTFTVNAKGLITAAANVTVTPTWASITSKPTTLSGYGITDGQPIDATLTALAGASWASGTQVLTLTATDTITLKTVGSGAGNILDRSAGDSLYLPIASKAADSDLLDGLDSLYFTNATNMAAGTLPAARMPALSGDITTSAGAVATTLATVNSNLGVFGSATQVGIFTVNAKGLTTAASNVTITPAWSSITSKPTTLTGYGITDAQGLDTGLTSLAGLTGAGVVTASGTDTFVMRAIGVTSSTDIPDRAAADTRYVQTSAYTAADVLSKLLTVDGAGTSLDADLLDGQQGSYYTNASTINAGTISDTYLPTTMSSKTFSGQIISTMAGSTSNGQLYLNGSTSNRIDFAAVGTAAPAFTTRSAGTKILLYPQLSGSAVDYAIGIESNNIWMSAPNSSTGFKWYAATSNIMYLSGAGVLTINGGTAWTSANDGSGSTLDADLLDGQEGTYYLAFANLTGKPTTVSGYGISDAVTTSGNQSIAGIKTFTGNVVLNANLIVNGTTTFANTVELHTAEVITLASASGGAAPYIGLKGERGATDAFWVFDESDDRWKALLSTNDLSTSSSAPIQASFLVSTIATGSAPLVVASTTLVTNLNADLLDGQQGSYYLSATNLNAGTIPGARMPALTGDVTTSAGAVATTLATVNSNVGAFGNATQAGTFTVNAKGLITAASNVTVTPAWSSITSKPTTISGFGITDAVTLSGNQTVAGNKTFSGNTTITSNIVSTSTTTGSLVVTGGVGISGALNAATKSFVIPHPTKPGMHLRYGSLEGPEFGVYVRGKLSGSNKIELPDYWIKLVDELTITVSLTAIGNHQNLFIESIENNVITVGQSSLFKKPINCFFTVFGERKDVNKLEVES